MNDSNDLSVVSEVQPALPGTDNSGDTETPEPREPPDPQFVQWLKENAVPLIGVLSIAAIFTFSKGRQFKESLVPSVSGRIAFIDGTTFIVVRTEIKNVGQSKIKFLDGASTLEVYEYIKTPVSEVITMPDRKLRQFNPLHEDDVYIEPNEIIYVGFARKVRSGYKVLCSGGARCL